MVPDLLLSPDELYIACGGPKVAAKLLDERHTGRPWDVLAQAAIRWGSAQALMAYGLTFDAQALQPPYPTALVEVAKYISAETAWNLGGAGIPMPPNVAAEAQRARDICQMWTERKRTTAATPESPNQQREDQIDPDPDDRNWTRRSTQGFW